MRAVQDAVARAGGVVRVGTLTDNGYTRRMIEGALDRGLLSRPKVGWLATPGADPYLLAAARAGVVVTCITQARRLGLWVLREDQPHVAASAHSGRVCAGQAHVHWARPLVPRHPNALIDPLENVLGLVAACQPYESALAVWESALRKGLVDVRALGRFNLPRAGRRLLSEVQIFSDSGLETFVVPRLRWLGLPLVRQAWIAGHRVDLLIGDRLVVQIDGEHHVGAQRDSDIAHDAALMLLGYHVIRVGYDQVVHRWHEVQDLIMRAVAQGLHLA